MDIWERVFTRKKADLSPAEIETLFQVAKHGTEIASSLFSLTMLMYIELEVINIGLTTSR